MPWSTKYTAPKDILTCVLALILHRIHSTEVAHQLTVSRPSDLCMDPKGYFPVDGAQNTLRLSNEFSKAYIASTFSIFLLFYSLYFVFEMMVLTFLFRSK